ncbi:MAG TPA: hypothetical protein VGJ08_07060 [Rhizomicrobium sp.]|jgi:hypothetical protein
MKHHSQYLVAVVALTMSAAAAPLAIAASTETQAGGNPAFDNQSTVAGRSVNEPQGNFDTWAHDWSTGHHGRITRDAYMEEMGRRWDAKDANRQGLTPSEVSELTGRVDSNALPARTGSGVQAGNMGPGNMKGK